MFPVEYIDNLITVWNNISHSSLFHYVFHHHINLHQVITHCKSHGREIQHVVFSANLNVGETKVLNLWEDWKGCNIFFVKDRATNTTSCIWGLWKLLDEVVPGYPSQLWHHTNSRLIPTVVVTPTPVFRCEDSVYFIMKITWGAYSLQSIRATLLIH